MIGGTVGIEKFRDFPCGLFAQFTDSVRGTEERGGTVMQSGIPCAFGKNGGTVESGRVV